MQVIHSASVKPAAAREQVARALDDVSEAALRETVRTLSYPRHFVIEPRENRRAAEWIAARLQALGCATSLEGESANVVAVTPAARVAEALLIGAHYDSVPNCPGADDNASAVAALLECARCLTTRFPETPAVFVAFNREEDGLLGSQEFVRDTLPQSGLRLREVHVLEMVGYCDPRPGSQRIPAELPIPVPDAGDFLGLIANRHSHAALDRVLTTASSYVADFPVVGLKVFMGLEHALPNLMRSDHAPFWQAGIPALMWTDTSEFRNPHYHRATDLPETLDYAFLRRVTQLLLAQVAAR